MNEQPNWREEGGEVLPPNTEPVVPDYQHHINRRDLDEMHPNFTPENLPDSQEQLPDGVTPLFPENNEELDAAVRRHPANPQPAKPQTNKKRSKTFSGPVRGDSEGDTGNPAYHEPYNPLTDEEKATGKAGVEAARRILEQNRPNEFRSVARDVWQRDRNQSLRGENSPSSNPDQQDQ